MPIADLSDCQLEYRLILGSADRPTCVFLHEGLGSTGLWRDFPDRVARRLGARALVYSRAGYGRSSALTTSRRTDYMHVEALDVLPRLLNKLGIERPLLIGHSDGASIALIFAAHHAASVAAVVLLAPHVFVEPITLLSIARLSETYETSDLRKNLGLHHDHVDDAFRGWAGTWLSPQFSSWTLGSEVVRLAVPTLLIQGADDKFGTLAQLDAFGAATNADVTRLVIRNCGHSPQRDQPNLVIDSIATFAAAKIATSE
jgi:pimeloyl-ACP methyl ester carboxylesterase